MQDSGAADPTLPTRMTPVQVVQFFVLLPTAMGLFFGAAKLGAYQFQTVAHHMAYMAGYGVLSWGCYGLGSIAAGWILRPWQPPLLVVLVIGHVLGGFALLWPLRDLFNRLFLPYLLPGSGFGAFWPPPAGHLADYLAISLQGMAWWVLANWLDFRLRKVPRFGFVPAAAHGAPEGPVSAPGSLPATTPAAAGATPEPRLLLRLPAPLRSAQVRALEAEEHYTKVHTSNGSTLLLLRFSDAITEMHPQAGLQVHRSFWVSLAAVERVVRNDRRWLIQLQGGMKVPVSRSYRVSVQAAGLTGSDTSIDD